jgi:PPE-repeat protein
MLDAADAWDRLADELYSTATSYRAIITTLTDEDWRGSASDWMAAAVGPYLSWLTNSAAQAEEVASQAKAAASAFETAIRRDGAPAGDPGQQGSTGIFGRGNTIGQNAPAISAVEADYAEMTSSGTSAAMPTKTAGWPQMAVSSAVGRGVLVGRLSVPRSWGDAAFGSLRSIA